MPYLNKKNRVKRVFCPDVTNESCWIHLNKKTGDFYGLVPELEPGDGGRLIRADTLDRVERLILQEMRSFYELKFELVIRVLYPDRARADAVMTSEDLRGSDVIGPLEVKLLSLARRLDGQEVRQVLSARDGVLTKEYREIGSPHPRAVDLPYSADTHAALLRFQEVIRSTDAQIRGLIERASRDPGALISARAPSLLEGGGRSPAVAPRSFNGAQMPGAAMAQADLKGVSFDNADLSFADLSRADLTRASMMGATLCGADLRWARLSLANLSEANLSGAKLSGASIEDVVAERAKLDAADLRAANLRGADLFYASLVDADLQGADLRGADLRGASLGGALLHGAFYSELTQVDHATDLAALGARQAPHKGELLRA